MQFAPAKMILSLLFSFYWVTGSAQQNKPPVNAWIADLAVKKDDVSMKFRSVYDQMTLLDSTARCSALSEMEKGALRGSARLQIRLAMLRALLLMASKGCQESPSAVELLENALRKAYEMEDHLLAAQLNQYLGDVYRFAQDFGTAAMYSQLAQEERKRVSEDFFRNVAYDLSNLGDLLYHLRDYREAVNITREAVEYPGNPKLQQSDTLTPYLKMNAWNTIGVCYERLGVYDSALVAFNKAYVLSGNDPFWSGLIKGNRGDVFFLQNQYDSAEVLLKYDYEQSLATQQYDNAALSLSRLARIYNTHGAHVHALEMLKEADLLERRMPNPDYRSHIMYAFAMVYKDLDMADSAFFYMQQYKEKTEALEKLTAHNRTEIVQLRMDNQESVYRILELNKEKQRIVLIRNFVILLILLGSVAGYLYLNRQRLRFRLHQQQILEEKRRAEAQSALALEQLEVFTKSVVDKTILIDNLQSQLLDKELNEEQVRYISELRQHAILTDEDWEKFKGLFEKVHPGFFHKLKSQVPDITLAEQRMAALTKLHVSVKEAATLLGISPNSVNKTRQRLRSRLGLSAETDLEKVLGGY